MSETLRRVQELIEKGEVLISTHGYDEPAEDEILGGDAINGVGQRSSSRTTPNIRRGHVLWSCSAMEEASRFMWSGAYPEGRTHQRF